MDNKDQYNNTVGDGSDLSHGDQLPSIWDNISQELNVFDELDASAEEVVVEDINELDVSDFSDVDDFSIIKEGFQQNFSNNQPPKFTWDKIEQGLESFTVTDAPSDFSAIKAGFEQTYKESKAPIFTWQDLEEQMDNPTPKTKAKDDYSFVKTGFEKKYSAVVVPLFSWQDLAERMDDEAALADTPDKFSIVKESFEKEYGKARPATAVWTTLNQELKMQTYWGKLTQYLTTSDFTKKAALFTAIGLLIGGGRSCLFEEGMFKSSTNEPHAITWSNSSDDLYQKVHPSTLKGTGIRSYVNDLKVLTGVPLMEQKLSETTSVTSNSTKDNKDDNSIDASALAANNNKDQTTKPVKSVNTKPTIDKPVTVEKTIESTEGNKREEKELRLAKVGGVTNSLPIISAPSNSANNVAERTVNNASLEENMLKENLIQLANGDDLNWLGEGAMDVEMTNGGVGILVQKHVNDPAFLAMREENFKLVRQAQKGKKVRFEVGLNSRIGTSMLLGKNTFNGFDQNHLSSTELQPTAAVGFMFNYYFSLNDAIVLGTNPYSKVQQVFGEYTSTGNYIKTEVDLSFLDFSVGYQRVLVRYNTLGKVPSRIYARFDLGLGYLMKSKTKVNGEFVLEDRWFNKFNVSTGLTLGNTHEVNQIIIDYGITGNVGLNNIVNTAANLEPASVLNVGAFVGLRYIILPRLEPSKKQRQFDWSPPFYVEEPAF